MKRRYCALYKHIDTLFSLPQFPNISVLDLPFDVREKLSQFYNEQAKYNFVYFRQTLDRIVAGVPSV